MSPSQSRRLSKSSVRVELIQLSHESWIGPHNGASSPQNLVSLVQAGVAGGAEVDQHKERGPRDPVDAMDKHSPVAKSGGVDEVVHLSNIFCHVLVLVVSKMEDEVAHFPELLLGIIVNTDNVSDPVPPQFFKVGRVLGAADEETRKNLTHSPLAHITQLRVESLAKRH